MKHDLRIVCVLSIAVLVASVNRLPVVAQEHRVRAKIGIQIRSGDRMMRARSRDRLKAGDLLRIYVHPEETSHVLVVYSDTKTARLLNLVHQKTRSSTLAMPSLKEFYQVDGESPIQTFTIICSPDPLTEALRVLRTGEAPYSSWAKVEKKLLDKSRIDLSQQTEKPFSIAGNVRGVGSVSNLDPFVDELQIFSGRSLLVKKYEFRVQK